MSSVFNDKISRISARIESLEDSRQGKLRGEVAADKPFAQILADLEGSGKNVKRNENLAALEGTAKRVSNLSPLEEERVKARLDKTITDQNERLSSISIEPKIEQPTVKTVEEAVNIQAAKVTVKQSQIMPYLKQVGLEPSLPAVLPQQLTPEMPKLLSLTEVPEPKDGGEKLGFLDKDELQSMITRASRKHGVDPTLSLALAQAESSFNPKAVSSDGFASKGLFQLLDTTGEELAKEANLGGSEYDPFNPELNSDLGVGYLRRLLNTFSTETKIGTQYTFPVRDAEQLEKLAVAAFNAGEGNVTAAQNRAHRQGLDPADFEDVSRFLPRITQEHVKKVMRYRTDFSDIG